MVVVMGEETLILRLGPLLAEVLVGEALEAHLVLAAQEIHRQHRQAKEIAGVTEPDQIKLEVVVVPVL
jgi:hypothetical protein